MDYEKKYKELEGKIKNAYLYAQTDSTKAVLEDIFPEIKESEDELTWLTKYIEEEAYSLSIDIRDDEDRIKLKKLQNALAWLEKQESVEEIVERCKDSWYNEGKIQGMREGLSDEEKYQQGWHDAIEKKVPVDKDKVVKGVRRGVATSLINYIDANSKGMCLSNMECEDIDDAIVDGKWYKVYAYMKKKLEKQKKGGEE